MAVNINAVVLTGNLTADPELRHTAGGTAVCGLRIAVNGREKRGEEWQDRADFFDVRVWGNQAENCNQYLARGRAVAVSGKLRLEEWESKGGEKKQRVLVEADSVQFLSQRGDGERSAAFVPDEQFAVPEGDFAAGAADADFSGAGGGADDDIPF